MVALTEDVCTTLLRSVKTIKELFSTIVLLFMSWRLSFVLVYIHARPNTA